MNFLWSNRIFLFKKAYPIFLICFFTASIIHTPTVGLLLLPLSLFSGKITTIVFAIAYNFTFFILLINLALLFTNKSSHKIIYKEKYLLSFILFSLASTLWSSRPIQSFDYFLVFAAVTSTGFLIGTHYSIKAQLDTLFWGLFILVLVNFFYVIFIPEVGIVQEHIHFGAWRGIFLSKNFLGPMMVLSALVSWFKLKLDQHPLAVVQLGLSSSLMFGSSSKTALLVYFYILGLIVFYWGASHLYKQSKKVFYISLFLSFLLLCLVYLNLDFLLGLVNRDLTLTGRTNLWPLILENIWLRPLFGYGFNSFWPVPSQEPLDIWVTLPWFPHHAHNAFLDICLELGFTGLTIFLVQLLFNGARIIRKARDSWGLEVSFYMLYYLFFLGINLTESMMFSQPLFWVIYVSLSLGLVKSLAMGKHLEEDQIVLELC